MSGFAPWDWFGTLDQEYRLAAFIIGAVLACVAVIAVAHCWRRVRESADRVAMMREMLGRGLSTEEISRLLLATQIASLNTDDETDPEDDPEAFIVKCLADHWYDGKDVDRILEAARVDGRIDPTTVHIVKHLAANWTGAKGIAQVLESRKQGAGQPARPAVAG